VLLDIGSVLGGIGLAVVGFLVVIVVCVVILRLLAALLPSYEDRVTGSSESSRSDPEDPESAAGPPAGTSPADSSENADPVA
jgi:hypothetical protein